MSALSMDEAREKYSYEDTMAEQAEIEKTFLSMKFGEQARQTTLACLQKCGYKVRFPFRVET